MFRPDPTEGLPTLIDLFPVHDTYVARQGDCFTMEQSFRKCQLQRQGSETTCRGIYTLFDIARSLFRGGFPLNPNGCAVHIGIGKRQVDLKDQSLRIDASRGHKRLSAHTRGLDSLC